jgi:hypothetical protein
MPSVGGLASAPPGEGGGLGKAGALDRA